MNTLTISGRRRRIIGAESPFPCRCTSHQCYFYFLEPPLMITIRHLFSGQTRFYVGRTLLGKRYNTTSSKSSGPREFKVVLDNETLYVDQQLAEALGWKPGQGIDGVPLTLSGWPPHYFAIARTGTDSGML